MPRTGWPAVPKTSIRGLRFFAHAPGFAGQLPHPESYAHTRLKIDVVKAARAMGFRAELEVWGTDGNGAEWIADALVFADNGAPVAFEIQLSSQHLDGFLARGERYQRSGVKCCWIMSERPVALRLTKALSYKNIQYYRETGEFLCDCEEIVPFAVDLAGKDTYPDVLPPVRFSRGRHIKRMPLSEAINGMLRGYPNWRLPDWHWRAPEVSVD
ncbi:hypothetical protein [Mesorhizobium captivum]|uniref:competence protein CoiA family protein n=1 Tax=Mesorhizobium captivum TaxID=3072319 RepID=UPI002A23AF9E|nr:hypothetical protein [Mesorhizobium sp. VK22E]